MIRKIINILIAGYIIDEVYIVRKGDDMIWPGIGCMIVSSIGVLNYKISCVCPSVRLSRRVSGSDLTSNQVYAISLSSER